jgi:hypothetical protein
MQITADVTLKGPVWAEMLDLLVTEYIPTYMDLYALSISIGMMYDGQIETDEMVPTGYKENPRSIPRNVLIQNKNKSLLEFMLQAAIITTKYVEFTEQERLEIAFSEKVIDKFSPIQFLTKYANYGIVKLKEAIGDAVDVELMQKLNAYLDDTYTTGYDPTVDLELTSVDD